MALNPTCPSCATGFILADDARGKKVFCSNCGTALFITSSGTVERTRRSRRFLVVTALVLVIGGLSVYLATACFANEEAPVASASTETIQPPTKVEDDKKQPPKQPSTKTKSKANLPVKTSANATAKISG